MMQTALIGIADIHARPLPHRFRAFELMSIWAALYF